MNPKSKILTASLFPRYPTSLRRARRIFQNLKLRWLLARAIFFPIKESWLRSWAGLYLERKCKKFSKRYLLRKSWRKLELGNWEGLGLVTTLRYSKQSSWVGRMNIEGFNSLNFYQISRKTTVFWNWKKPLWPLKSLCSLSLFWTKTRKKLQKP